MLPRTLICFFIHSHINIVSHFYISIPIYIEWDWWVCRFPVRRSEVHTSILDFLSLGADLILDIHEAVILRDSLSPSRCTRLQVPGPETNGQVGDKVIDSFAGAVGDEDTPAVAEGEIGSLNSFRDGTDLVYFQQETITSPPLPRHLHPLHIRNRQIITHNLRQMQVLSIFHELRPGLPIILCEGIFQQDNRVLRQQFR